MIVYSASPVHQGRGRMKCLIDQYAFKIHFCRLLAGIRIELSDHDPVLTEHILFHDNRIQLKSLHRNPVQRKVVMAAKDKAGKQDCRRMYKMGTCLHSATLFGL